MAKRRYHREPKAPPKKHQNMIDGQSSVGFAREHTTAFPILLKKSSLGVTTDTLDLIPRTGRVVPFVIVSIVLRVEEVSHGSKQATRVHSDRAPRGHRHHRGLDRAIAAGGSGGT